MDELSEWVAFFYTDPSATVGDVFAAVTGRFAAETCFRDVKEMVGADRQQVRWERAYSVGATNVANSTNVGIRESDTLSGEFAEG